MNRVALVLIVVAVVVLLGWGISQVGNVGVRRVQPAGTRVQLSVSEPVLPGVQTLVRWNMPLNAVNRAVVLEVHAKDGNTIVGEGELTHLSAAVPFPCLEDTSSVSLVMLDEQTNQVIASSPIAMLPPGPDCAP